MQNERLYFPGKKTNNVVKKLCKTLYWVQNVDNIQIQIGGRQSDKDHRANSITTLTSHVVYVSSLTSEAQELLLRSFGLTGEMTQKHISTFRYSFQILSDQQTS